MEKFYTLAPRGTNLNSFFSTLFCAKEVIPSHWIIYDHKDYLNESVFTLRNYTFCNSKYTKKADYKDSIKYNNVDLVEIRIYKTGKIRWNKAL